MKKGLTLTIAFKAEGLNYGEGIGNYSVLKKMSDGNGNEFPYISRQALSHMIREQMGIANTPLSRAAKIEGENVEGKSDSSVIQYRADTSILDYPEIDLFGYMKTASGKEDGSKKSSTRSAVVRLTDAVSTTPFNGDSDFLTNGGLFTRMGSSSGAGGNIAQNEKHRGYYVYTMTMDLDRVGKEDQIDGEEISAEEKAERVCGLLDTVGILYRDIKGRREDLAPVFLIGGVYQSKNPIFLNALKIKKETVNIERLKESLERPLGGETYTGVLTGEFKNEKEIKDLLNALTPYHAIERIKDDVKKYFLCNK